MDLEFHQSGFVFSLVPLHLLSASVSPPSSSASLLTVSASLLPFSSFLLLSVASPLLSSSSSLASLVLPGYTPRWSRRGHLLCMSHSFSLPVASVGGGSYPKMILVCNHHWSTHAVGQCCCLLILVARWIPTVNIWGLGDHNPRLASSCNASLLPL